MMDDEPDDLGAQDDEDALAALSEILAGPEDQQSPGQRGSAAELAADLLRFPRSDAAAGPVRDRRPRRP
jgi:hypothetical protein